MYPLFQNLAIVDDDRWDEKSRSAGVALSSQVVEALEALSPCNRRAGAMGRGGGKCRGTGLA